MSSHPGPNTGLCAGELLETAAFVSVFRNSKCYMERFSKPFAEVGFGVCQNSFLAFRISDPRILDFLAKIGDYRPVALGVPSTSLGIVGPQRRSKLAIP